MAFPPAFLDEVAARNPIEEVVGQYVNLRRSGGNLFGLCPFHGEKTASFSVAPDKGIYYCFGCHKGGSVINFQMEIEGMSYPDAVRALAQRAGLEVPEDEEYRSRYRKQERLWGLHKEAARFFNTTLYTPQGEAGLAYARKRGMPKSTLTKFGIGFAPDSWDALVTAMKAKGYTEEELKDAGLVSVSGKNGRIYDRFRNRLMFPIIDVRGNVIGFGGRVMDDSTPKYLNSPETEIFNKRKNLFALNLAKKSKLGYLILVEGYMDAVALHQYGFDCAVASLGTSLTEEHAALLARYTENVVLIYDGDQAGQNATRRAIPMLEKVGLRVKVLQMKDAKDPDEYLKKFGADRFRLLLEQSSDRVEYQLNTIRRKYDLTQDEQRVRFIAEAAEFISTLSNAVQREIYGGRAAEAAKITPEAMKIEVEKAFKNRTRREKKKQERIDLSPAVNHQPKTKEFHYNNVKSAMAEEKIIAMVMKENALLDVLKDLQPEQFSSGLLGKVYGQIRSLAGEGLETKLASLTDLTPEESAHIAAITQRENTLVNEEELRDCADVVRREYQKAQAKAQDDFGDYFRSLQARKGMDK